MSALGAPPNRSRFRGRRRRSALGLNPVATPRCPSTGPRRPLPFIYQHTWRISPPWRLRRWMIALKAGRHRPGNWGTTEFHRGAQAAFGCARSPANWCCDPPSLAAQRQRSARHHRIDQFAPVSPENGEGLFPRPHPSAANSRRHRRTGSLPAAAVPVPPQSSRSAGKSKDSSHTGGDLSSICPNSP